MSPLVMILPLHTRPFVRYRHLHVEFPSMTACFEVNTSSGTYTPCIDTIDTLCLRVVPI